MMKMKGGFIGFLGLLMLQPPALAYPLDGAELTGIERLQAYRQAPSGTIKAPMLPPGALLSTAEVDLRLTAYPELSLPAADPKFTTEVVALVNQLSKGRSDDFGIAVLDLSDIEHPVYAEHRATRSFYPGSVGKLGIAMGIFQALARAYPNDIDARRRVLRETQIVADAFIRYDHHEVPIWQTEKQRLYHRELREGDIGNLWTYLDWMLSASSNAAASMSIKHMMLLSQFGREYPLDEAKEQEFFSSTPKDELSLLMAQAFQDGLDASGLDGKQFRQGSFFTKGGKRQVPGERSYATPRELMRFLLQPATPTTHWQGHRNA